MKTKIKYNELEDVSKFIESKVEEIDKVYQDITNSINSLKDVWIGDACEEFIPVAIENTEKEHEKNKNLKHFGDLLNSISHDYKNMDDSWNEKIKKENIDNG